MIVHLDYVNDLISRKDKIKELGIGPGVLEIRNLVDGNRTELNDEDVKLLTTALQSNIVLNTLKLDDCILSDLKGELRALIVNCKINSIIFNGLDLNDSVLAEIGEGLKQNTSLQNITFDNVNFELGHNLNIFIEGLASNNSLNNVMFRKANLPTDAIERLINHADSQTPLIWSKFYILDNNPELNATQKECMLNIRYKSMGIGINNKRLRH